MWAHAKPEKSSIFIAAIKLDLDRAEQNHRKLDGWISSIIKFIMENRLKIYTTGVQSVNLWLVIGWWKINRKNRCLESRLSPLHSFSFWLTQQIIFFSNAPKNRLAEKKSRNETKREDESSYENPTTAGKDGKTENCSTHMRKVEQSTFYLKRERQQQIKWMSGI